ncbi:MAG: sulfur oxidation c-type cytochrome SoxX [Arenicellales bacterium WSBS_2016_MAG_OTU3]
MQQHLRTLAKPVFVSLTLAVLAITAIMAITSSAAMADAVSEGKDLAFDRKKGNCLACHIIAGGSLPGNSGPPLVSMQQRFPDKAKLRAQIYDATKDNPNTLMPPFGRHGILSDAEIDKITAFIHSI